MADYRRWSIRTGTLVGMAVAGLVELLNWSFDFWLIVFGGTMGILTVSIRNDARFGDFGRDSNGRRNGGDRYE